MESAKYNVTKLTRRKLGRSVSTLTPAFCPKKKGRQSRPFLGANCLSVEAPDPADAQYVDVGLAADIVASDILIALPFATDAELAADVVLHP